MSKILTVEEENKLRKPIDDYVGKIQEKIDALRVDGTDKVISLQSLIESIKRDKTLSTDERNKEISELQTELKKAESVENANKNQIAKYISEAETYIDAHFDKEYYTPVILSCEEAKKNAKAEYQSKLGKLALEHKENLSKLSDHQEIKDENYVYKNRLFDAKLEYEKHIQDIKDRKMKWENYKYSFNVKKFLLQNGLYLAIILIFIGLSIITPIIKGSQLLTYNNVLNILQQASPKMYLALGVAGLILLTGTDLSIGRMIGMGMTVATIIMHQGVNTGQVFGHAFDFTGLPVGARVVLALVVCIILCTFFTSIAGFFTAKFKMHPFISTMANMLVIFGLATYATKGVSFGAIESNIPDMIIPKLNGFPTIILWAVAAIAVVWFIWNKTPFGKNLYAVGGNPEAASASGISVFAVTLGAFILAGILYGFGAWLECARMVGSGSAAYGQGWEMDAIAACVVGGISFTGGIGKISGVVVGVLIFTALTYSLTILGIDTNLQFVFEGIIILVAVTLDCLKYVQKK